LPGVETGALEFLEEGEDACSRVVLAHVGGEDVIEVGVAVNGVGAGDESGEFVLAEGDEGEQGAGLGGGNFVFDGGRLRCGEPGGESAGAAEEVAAIGGGVVDGFEFRHAVHEGAGRVVFHTGALWHNRLT
jgi:hypothetical protein